MVEKTLAQVEDSVAVTAPEDVVAPGAVIIVVHGEDVDLQIGLIFKIFCTDVADMGTVVVGLVLVILGTNFIIYFMSSFSFIFIIFFFVNLLAFEFWFFITAVVLI